MQVTERHWLKKAIQTALLLSALALLPFVALMICGVALFAYLTFAPMRVPSVPFDSAEWIEAADDCGTGTRLGMLSDLRANYLVPGTPREDVLAILGPPDYEFDPGPRMSWYCMGPREKYFSFDRQYLSLEFDGAGRLLLVSVAVK